MSHRRYNPLLDEWVIVAADRLKRPWQGSKEATSSSFSSSDQINPLAPGGVRANGQITPNYESTFVFDNDFASFQRNNAARKEVNVNDDFKELFRSEPINGLCRVICYHPDTTLTMPRMTIDQIGHIIDVWCAQMDELQTEFNWIQIFENKGAMVGCSNSHPHGQLWASDFLPNDPAKKHLSQKTYQSRTGRIMLMDIVEQEIRLKERLVLSNDDWIVIVPFWAYWPFETMLLPRKHIIRLNEMNKEQKHSLASIMRTLLIKYDNLFRCSFPFSMGWQGAPTGSYLEEDCSFWTLHAVYLPPLLRSATVKKFMAGYELVCEPQRDITPEKAAEMLRDVSSIHYSQNQ